MNLIAISVLRLFVVGLALAAGRDGAPLGLVGAAILLVLLPSRLKL